MAAAVGSLLSLMQSRLVERLRRSRHIQSRVSSEKAVGLEHHTHFFNGHHGEILDTGVVSQTEGFIFD